MIIKQKHYANLMIDRKERDIVQIWMLEKTDPQVIQIERENLDILIEQLQRKIRLTGSFKTLPQADVSSNEAHPKKNKKVGEVAVCPVCQGKGWYFVNERIGSLQGRKDCKCKGQTDC